MIEKSLLEGTQKVIILPTGVEADNKYTPSETTLNFTFCGPEQPNGQIGNPYGFATCRESLQTMIENEVLKNSESRKLPVDKGRFIFKIQAAGEPRLEKAIAILHLYEREYGIPLSLCFRIGVVSPGIANENMLKVYGTKCKLFYLVTSRKWIKSSYMASLLMLIIRSFYIGGGIIPDSAAESLEKFREFTKKAEFSPIMAYSYVKDTIRHWEFILKNYQELFGKFSIEHNWSHSFNETRDDKTMRYEGVYRLTVPSQCCAAKVRKRWEKLTQPPKQPKP